MNFYIEIAILAYLMFAVNAVIDKFLLKKAVPHATTYAFFIGMLSLSAILLIPFGVKVPSPRILIIALLSGALFIYALAAFYEALRKVEATRVLPLIGALVPLTTFFLSWYFVGERLSQYDILGMGFLVAGTVVVTYGSDIQQNHKKNWLAYAIVSAVIFALSFTLAKVVYNDQHFISGLVWTRLGCVAGALTLLLLPKALANIKETFRGQTDIAPSRLFVIGQVLGAAGAILQNYAVSLGKVTLVNALQGTQYAFLFVLTWFISRSYPKFLKEDFSGKRMFGKLSGTILIILGLFLVA